MNRAIFLIIAIGTVFALGLGGVLTREPSSNRPASTAADEAELNAAGFTMGSQNPKITLVEFSDFLCPACASAQPVLKQLTADFPELAVRYRHFPIQSDSYLYAQAAESAGKQNKFFELADLLFENQNNLSRDKVLELAQTLNLNLDQFKTDLDSETSRQKVEADAALSEKLGLSGTPTFFIGGEEIAINNFNDLRLAVENALK